jgi:hypothetical protein
MSAGLLNLETKAVAAEPLWVGFVPCQLHSSVSAHVCSMQLSPGIAKRKPVSVEFLATLRQALPALEEKVSVDTSWIFKSRLLSG